MNIQQAHRELARSFMELTSITTPYGHEKLMRPFLPDGIEYDKTGNGVLVIGEKPEIIWSCHLDTADGGDPRPVEKYLTDGGFMKTDGTTLLGADDKAGAAIMCAMISQKMPGAYVFHVGEERGGIGSSAITTGTKPTWAENAKQCVAFDRRGYSDVIYRQGGEECASMDYAKAVSAGMPEGMSPSPHGSFTDSKNYRRWVAECINISCGYHGAHGNEESQDIVFLHALLQKVLTLDWWKLPIERDPSKMPVYQPALNHYRGHHYGVDPDDYSEYGYRSPNASGQQRSRCNAPVVFGNRAGCTKQTILRRPSEDSYSFPIWIPEEKRFVCEGKLPAGTPLEWSHRLRCWHIQFVNAKQVQIQLPLQVAS